MKKLVIAAGLIGLLAACSQQDSAGDAPDTGANAQAESAALAPAAAPEATPSPSPSPTAPPTPLATPVKVAPGIWVEKSEVIDVRFDGVAGSEEELAAARDSVTQRPRQERRRCRTRDEPIVPLPESRAQRCDVQRYAVADGSVDVRVACPDPRGEGTVITAVTGSYGDTRSELVQEMRGPWPGGGTMRVRLRVIDERVGACIGDAAD